MNPLNSLTPFAPADDNGTNGGGTADGGTLTDVRHKIAESAKDAAAKVKSAASQTMARAKNRAEDVVTERKDTTANRIGNYGSAIHDSARALEEKDPNIAWFTHIAADKVQEVADYMRSRDIAGLRDDAASLARRHPAAFFGGLFVAGLVLGNVVKASQRATTGGPSPRPSGSDGQSPTTEFDPSTTATSPSASDQNSILSGEEP